MKLFQPLTKNASPEDCAQELLELIPLVMRTIRSEMRSRRKPDLSVPQFRTLAFLSHFPESSLSLLAEHLGLTLPSSSKIVDALVERELVVRRTSNVDRRRVRLSLTPSGKARFDAAREATLSRLAELLVVLSEKERVNVIAAMRSLKPIFATQVIKDENSISRNG